MFQSVPATYGTPGTPSPTQSGTLARADQKAGQEAWREPQSQAHRRAGTCGCGLSPRNWVTHPHLGHPIHLVASGCVCLSPRHFFLSLSRPQFSSRISAIGVMRIAQTVSNPPRWPRGSQPRFPYSHPGLRTPPPGGQAVLTRSWSLRSPTLAEIARGCEVERRREGSSVDGLIRDPTWRLMTKPGRALAFGKRIP